LIMRIEFKNEFTAFGREWRLDADTCQQVIPGLWKEIKPEDGIHGEFGICVSEDENIMRYLIADLYRPWQPLPEQDKVLTIAAGEWAVFPCDGEIPQDLQSLIGNVYQEWLPSHPEWTIRSNISIEFYLMLQGMTLCSFILQRGEQSR